jgi:hypothetical protein
MAGKTGATAWKPERNLKATSIGRDNIKTSSMNKSKKRSFKAYRGQGK